MSSNDDQIAQAEGHFGVRFPEDYRHFLAREGSMARFVPPADDFLMINALTELIEVNEAGDFQERFPRSVVIGGDGSREMLTYDFRQDPRLWSSRRLRSGLVVRHPTGNFVLCPARAVPRNRMEMGRLRALALLTGVLTELCLILKLGLWSTSCGAVTFGHAKRAPVSWLRHQPRSSRLIRRWLPRRPGRRGRAACASRCRVRGPSSSRW